MKERLNKLIDDIVFRINPDFSLNEKIRYVYITCGRIFTKNVKFFYSLYNKQEGNSYSFDEIKDIYYDDYVDDDLAFICKSSSLFLKEVFDRIGIESSLVSAQKYLTYYDDITGDEININHYVLKVIGENNKEYCLSLMSDLINIQFGMQTTHFANNKENFDTLSEEELLKIDTKIGYISPYLRTNKRGNITIEQGYNNIFLSLLREKVGNSLFYEILTLESDFYNSIMNYKIGDTTIKDIINNNQLDENNSYEWINYIDATIKEKVSPLDSDYKSLLGKVNGLKQAIKNRNGSKFRYLIIEISKKFLDLKFIDKKDGIYTKEYVDLKFKKMFPLLIGAMEEGLKPLTASFNGFYEQLKFVDLFIDNMFDELNTKEAIKLNDNSDKSVPNKMIRKYAIHKIVNDKDVYKILFMIDGINKYYYFDPENGEFKSVDNIDLFLKEENYTIVSARDNSVKKKM